MSIILNNWILALEDWLYVWPYSEYVEYHYVGWISPCSEPYWRGFEPMIANPEKEKD